MGKQLKQTELIVQLDRSDWQIKPIDASEGILGPVDYGWKRHQQDPDSFTFGSGLLAGTSIPGARRLVFTGYSPQWQGFYISSLGGAAYTLRHFGVNYVCLRGRCAEPSVLLLNYKNGEWLVELQPFDYQSAWKGHPNADGEEVVGVFALQEAIFAQYKDAYHPKRVRVFAVGPAAEQTIEAGIGSNTVDKGVIKPTIEWCGRGGLGSELLQKHNLVGCIFGGDWDDLELNDPRVINAYFMDHFGEKVAKFDLAVTQKYRFHPEFNTGGTFGVNNHTNRDRMMTHNYRSLYATNDERKEQHKNFVADHFLKQFNEETIETKSFENCGEPCLVKCKKMHGKYKKDYEPYHALGPQLGIFDQRAAELINDHIDAMGFDAIQMGGLLAWIMECAADGVIEPERFGFPPADQLQMDFASKHEQFDIVTDSMTHAKYAMAVTDAILWDDRAAIFRQGIRVAAYALNEMYPETQPLQRAVFLTHREKGSMVPNQYWVPGMGSPMPIMGKYYVHYGNEFMTPADLGRKNVERMVYELLTDNVGVCRFHRKWSETITDEILKEHYDLDTNFKNHHYELAQAINQQEGRQATSWETERMGDLFEGYLQYWIEMGLEEPQLLEYWAQIQSDKKRDAMQGFWQAILDAQEHAFNAGPDLIPDALTDGQKKALMDSA